MRFNSISMRGFEKLDEWQKLDHRKICKKAFSHLDFLNLFLGGKGLEQQKHMGTKKQVVVELLKKGTGLVFFCAFLLGAKFVEHEGGLQL